MAMRLAVAAVVASDRWLDEARAVDIFAACEGVAMVAGMSQRDRHGGRGHRGGWRPGERRRGRRLTQVSCDGVADEGTQLIVCHGRLAEAALISASDPPL